MAGQRIFSIDRRAMLAGIAAAGLAGCAQGANGAGGKPDGFVRRDGSRFTRGGSAYRYAGANAWYLAWLGSDTKYGDRARLGRELDRLQAIGVGNVRLLAGAEESPVKNSIKPGFEVQDGTLNTALLAGLDVAMAELGKRGMTAVLYLTNNWEWSGGMMSRLYWETGQYTNMNDPADPWPAFPDAGSAFYANQPAVKRFFGYVRTLVTRTNSVTGTAYRDDPDADELAALQRTAPRAFRRRCMQAILPAYYKWIDDSAALIRSLDPNHLVSLGHGGHHRHQRQHRHRRPGAPEHRLPDRAYLAAQLGLGRRQGPRRDLGRRQGQGGRLYRHPREPGRRRSASRWCSRNSASRATASCTIPASRPRSASAITG